MNHHTFSIIFFILILSQQGFTKLHKAKNIKAHQWRIASKNDVKNFNPKPILLSEMFRHGARTPDYNGHFKSSAPYVKQIEDIGYGNLTGNGEHMHLLLGMQMKKDYPSLFDPESPNFHDFQSARFKPLTLPKINNFQYDLRSSSVHRCIVSAQSHLLGIYPPGSQIGDHLNHPDHEFAYKPSYDHLEVSFYNKTNSALPMGLRVFPVVTQNPDEDKYFFPALTKACNLPYDVGKDQIRFSNQKTEEFLIKGGSVKRLEDAGFKAQLYIPGSGSASSKKWTMVQIANFYDSLR